jgi:hypothetical protein
MSVLSFALLSCQPRLDAEAPAQHAAIPEIGKPSRNDGFSPLRQPSISICAIVIVAGGAPQMTPPLPLQTADRSVHGIPTTGPKRKIVAENAARLYGFDIGSRAIPALNLPGRRRMSVQLKFRSNVNGTTEHGQFYT